MIPKNIGFAIAALSGGHKVARAGWNGKNMSLELQVPDANSKMTQPYVFLNTAQGDRIPWTCSQADLLADDYMIVDEAE